MLDQMAFPGRKIGRDISAVVHFLLMGAGLQVRKHENHSEVDKHNGKVHDIVC